MAATSNACKNPPTVQELLEGNFVWKVSSEPLFRHPDILHLPHYYVDRIAKMWSGEVQSCWFYQFAKGSTEWKQRHFRVPGFKSISCNSMLFLFLSLLGGKKYVVVFFPWALAQFQVHMKDDNVLVLHCKRDGIFYMIFAKKQR